MSTAAKDGSPPERRRPRRRTEAPKKKRSVFAIVGQAGAVVSLVTGLASLIFLFRPGCQPQAPVDLGSAAITDVRVERGVTFGQFLERLDLPRGTLSPGYLARRGVLVQFHFAVKGFKDKPLPLESQLIDDGSHELIGGSQRGIAIKPQTNDEERDWFVWAPVPRTRDTYHLVVTIYQPDGRVPLRAFPTKPFAGLGA